MKPPLLVYLAGPLTNVASDLRAEGQAICDATKRIFRAYPNAHFVVYDPRDHTAPGSTHSADDVYITDHRRAMDADLIVFYMADAPSYGAGMEAQIAADATVPKVVAHREAGKVSRMLGGLFSPTVAEFTYVDLQSYEQAMNGLLEEIAAATAESAVRRKPAREKIVKANLGRAVFKQRIRRRVKLDDVARLTDIRVRWLQQLERNDMQSCCLTVIQLYRLAEVLDCDLALGAGSPTLHPSGGPYPRNTEESLDNLVTFVRTELPEWESDAKLFRLWEENTAQQLTGCVGRDSELKDIDRVISVEDWRNRYNESGLF